MIKLAILGASGRMGSVTAALAATDERFQIVAALTAPDDPAIGRPLEAFPAVKLATDTDAPFDVLIDFSLPGGTDTWLQRCVSQRAAMVIGATGHSPEQLQRITAAAHQIAIVQATNCSVGINALLAMIGPLARKLGADYDIEIVETHHQRKVDAPSGTALTLLDALLEATGRDRERDVVFGRLGKTGPRPEGQIGVHSLRLGDVVGRHEVHFSGSGESLVITHTAESRETFARGALRAAAWVAARSPGLYSMADVLAG